MLKNVVLFSVFAMAGLGLASATTFGAGPTPPPPSGPGSIVNETPTEPGKIGAWVFRTGDDGLALNIQPIPFSSKFKGYLRQYTKTALGYTPTDIKLQVDATAGTAPANLGNLGIEVSMEPKTSNGVEYFDLTYLATGGTVVKVGAVRFVDGSAGRTGADVVLRVNANFKSVTRNPCDEPPVDDMGEEEILDQSASTLPLTAVASETVE